VPDRLRVRIVRVLLGTVVAAVAILVTVVLAQSSELTVPTKGACRGSRGALARCLSTVTSERSTALAFAWIGVAALLAGGAWLLFRGSRLLQRWAAQPAPVPRLTSPTDPDVKHGYERRGPSHGATQRPAHQLSTNAEKNEHVVSDRALLVDTCIAVRELVESAALREQLDDALRGVGVTAVQAAAGEPFDPAQYRATGTVATTESALDDMVARTQRRGYLDRGRRLSYPEVLVYTVDNERQR
jgi:hypothetical protein